MNRSRSLLVAILMSVAVDACVFDVPGALLVENDDSGECLPVSTMSRTVHKEVVSVPSNGRSMPTPLLPDKFSRPQLHAVACFERRPLNKGARSALYRTPSAEDPL